MSNHTATYYQDPDLAIPGHNSSLVFVYQTGNCGVHCADCRWYGGSAAKGRWHEKHIADIWARHVAYIEGGGAPIVHGEASNVDSKICVCTACMVPWRMAKLARPKRVKVTGGLYRGKVPDGAVYVGRAHPGLKQSPFANPWCIKPPGHLPFHQHEDRTDYVVRHHRDTSRIAGGFSTREAAARAAVLMFRSHLDDKPELRARIVEELRGRDLACWCKPDEACHADVLLKIANGGGS